jgi:IS4 transposase
MKIHKHKQRANAVRRAQGVSTKPTKTTYTTLRQIFQYIPEGLPERLAREAGADIRKFSCTSHVAALLCGHLTRASSLNEICDAGRLHEGELNRIRGAVAPKCNTFSNANRTRDPIIAEQLYWETFKYLEQICPSFTGSKRNRKYLSRMRRKIEAIDSTTLKLSLDCIDWAKHRRKKAAAKTHMRIDTASMLPRFAVVEEASHHDSTRAAQLCSDMSAGDVLTADRAYVDLSFLFDLHERGIFFVLREKKNMLFDVQETRPCDDARIISDQIVMVSAKKTAKNYPQPLRRVTATVEVDGKDVVMTFLTNNMQWSPRTISELYRARWSIEIFFKEIKQTLLLSDFVGYNDKAVKWQVWIGLLAHLLLRFLKHVSEWKLSFSRLAGTVRSAVWMKIDLLDLLRRYGTAGAPKPMAVVEIHPVFKGFERECHSSMG